MVVLRSISGVKPLPGCFAVGEIAGTHGVTRPGGAALNAGQVFAMRLARYIAHAGRRNAVDDVPELAAQPLAEVNDVILRAQRNESGRSLQSVKEEIQTRMSDHGGFICHVDAVRQAAQEARLLAAAVAKNALSIRHLAEIPELFMWRQMALISAAVLTMLDDYISAGGGSRGARIILDPEGDCLPLTRNGPAQLWRFRPEQASDKEKKLTIHYQQAKFIVRQKP